MTAGASANITGTVTNSGNGTIAVVGNDKLEAQLVGKPARASATWLYMRPTAQNCFYDSVSNSINIFPGYITSAIYKKDMSQEELLAGAGFTIGHEISHAFDYSGSQFDACGQPNAVFGDADVQEFLAIRQKIAERYSTFEVTPGTFIDGEAVNIEATADLCGLQAALARAGGIEGFDYERFFERFARSWAAVYSPADADSLLADAHAPSNLRVNASAQMFEEFYATYGAADGNAMYLAPEDRITLWGKSSS
jgi:putative endopeptidase